MYSNALIKKLSRKARITESKVIDIWNESEKELIEQGFNPNEKRFNPYVLILVKKKLEINETSIIIMRFREFLKEKDEAKGI